MLMLMGTGVQVQTGKSGNWMRKDIFSSMKNDLYESNSVENFGSGHLTVQSFQLNKAKFNFEKKLMIFFIESIAFKVFIESN